MSLGDEAFLQRDYIGAHTKQAVREAVRERRIAGIS